MAELVLKGVSKGYPGGVLAVRDVTLEVRDKEFLVLAGPSGCGKSTLLRLIAGLDEPTAGEILVDGRRVNGVAPKDRDIAMVFQNYALYPHMTAYDNMAFALTVRKQPRKEVESRVSEAAEMLGIAHLLRRKPKALSGGERQRVALGRAIVRKPKLFLLDEPLSNLDAKLRVAMRAELIRLHRRLQTSMIYVTHDQAEAMTMGDRIALLKGGIVQQIAPPLALYARPANMFAAGFIGTPAMNFIGGILNRDAAGFRFDAASLQIPLPADAIAAMAAYAGREVVLGIRPEHITCLESGSLAVPSWECQVDVIEPMGSETWVYLSAEDRPLIARLPPSRDGSLPKAGERLRVTLDMARARFFDPDTEAAI